MTSEVGLEGQRRDLDMTRKVERWGLCPEVLGSYGKAITRGEARSTLNVEDPSGVPGG